VNCDVSGGRTGRTDLGHARWCFQLLRFSGGPSGTAKSDLCDLTSSSISADDSRHRQNWLTSTESPKIDDQSVYYRVTACLQYSLER